MAYTLAFDVYGTLINTSGVYNSLKKLIGDDTQSFMELWRNKQLEYSFRRGLMNRFVDFSIVTKEALIYCCKSFKIDLDENQQAQLMNTYKILPAFSDVENALAQLKESKHHLFAFSNGSHQAVSGLLKNSGIMHYFDGVVSVENTKMFKPSPIVYKHFNTSTNSKKSESWLISGNPFDVIGAKSYGMQSVWVQRSSNTVFDNWDIEPNAIVNNLNELYQVLS